MKAARPPRLWEWLGAASADRRDRQVVLGDLTEEFTARLGTEGRRAARRWYRHQVVRSLGPNLRRRLRSDVEPVSRGALMGSLLHDLQFGWRMARRRPLVTSVAVVSLVVGLGSSMVVFSLLNAVLFRPLRLADPDQLGLILERRDSGFNDNFSYRDFTEFRGVQQSFTVLMLP